MWLPWRTQEPEASARRYVGRVRLADGDVVLQQGYARYIDLLPEVDDGPLMTPGQAARSAGSLGYRPSHADDEGGTDQ
jgi:hypothetical protein